MSITVIENSSNTITLQVSVDVSGPLLCAEGRILEAVNEMGCALTQNAIKQHDTDGSPILTGGIKWTRRCRSPKQYHTPYGTVSVERNVYQTSQGGKAYIPLDSAGRILKNATPRFAMMASNKYARLNAAEVCNDLAENHGKTISRQKLQQLADSVGSIAQAKEESWSYKTPLSDEQSISTVVCSLDGANLLTVNDGWRQAMVGAISLYDIDGERHHTTYFGAAPEYGKADFFKRFEKELAHVKALYPEALYLGIADGAVDNWTFLEKHTQVRVLDFFHATEYLGKVAYAAHPEKTGKPARQAWMKEHCHRLKHESGAAQEILQEMKKLKRRRKLSEQIRANLSDAITYFENHIHIMDYAFHVEMDMPIGSGVTEAACKTLVKQRFCCSGMRWKEAGIKTVLSLRALVQTKGRWQQFWSKIEQFGLPC